MSIAVVGCGYWGKNLVRNFYQLETLSMVCDATPGGRAVAQTIAPQAQIESDFDRVLASDVLGVAIATPAETHHTLVARALRAGKDVFVEKPLALTYEQGHELVQLAQQHKRILMVGHVLEYHPAVTTLYQLVNSGELGKVHYIYSVSYTHLTLPTNREV